VHAKVGLSASFGETCGAAVPAAQAVVDEECRRDACTTKSAESRKLLDFRPHPDSILQVRIYANGAQEANSWVEMNFGAV